MIINNLNGLIKVLVDKYNHSKYNKSDVADTYFFDDLSFKVDKNKIFSSEIHYLNRFKPFLYYEWSKRKYENDNTGGYMCVFCKAVRIERTFTTIVFNNFSLDTPNFLKQIDKKNDDLNNFCFNDLKLSFFIDDSEDALNDENKTFLNELCELKARDVDLDIYLINQYITDGEYCLFKEDYHEELREARREPETYEEEVINTFESFKSDDCVICFNEKPNILFCNCGHIAICIKCNELLKNNKCPICRKENAIKRKI